MTEPACVYIISNVSDTVLYIGVTHNLHRRLLEHKEGKIEGFTKRYKVFKLVYYEVFEKMTDAIMREKQLKHWNREWKDNLINGKNPKRQELSASL